MFLQDYQTGNFSYLALDTNRITQRFSYEIPVTEVMHVKVSPQSISDKFHNLPQGKFEDSFADLQAAAVPYQNVQLTKLEFFLHDDASKGSEVFEALGVKFPANQITVWGIVVLLGIQLYYFVCLESAPRKNDDHADLSVPWLGMSSSRLSRCILFITSVLLPPAAGLLVWKRAVALSQIPALLCGAAVG